LIQSAAAAQKSVRRPPPEDLDKGAWRGRRLQHRSGSHNRQTWRETERRM